MNISPVQRIRVTKLYSQLTPERVFPNFSNRQYFFYLDSSLNRKNWGRFSYIGYEPEFVIRAKGSTIEIVRIRSRIVEKYETEDSLGLISDLIGGSIIEAVEEASDLPFTGGFVGYFSYDFGLQMNGLKPRKKERNVFFWDYEFGYYDFIAAYDHIKKVYYLCSLSESGDEKSKEFEAILRKGQLKERIENIGFIKFTEFKSVTSKDEFVQAVKKVKENILDGNVYVLNLSNRFEFNSSIDPVLAYERIRSFNRTDFSAFLNFKEKRILCTSPELFIRIRGKKIQTKPIKGTCRRGFSREEDIQLKTELKKDPKERAELAMVVDLERNDFSKICKANSVRVDRFASIETYPGVHHLVSLVEGEIEGNLSVKNLLKAVFPGGSITGAPKISAMRIIDELENFNRGIYAGSIGYFSINGNVDLNIVIRTLINQEERWILNTGSGITIDSNEEKEFEETIIKASTVLQPLGLKI
ncbi:MAG: aminodeoxychorismate synthase component I [Actinobacteria bacterium]|nr:aminodeoxychorismate synthase component I [Actinomycetota bacterium]